jgi:streptogramin lyase
MKLRVVLLITCLAWCLSLASATSTTAALANTAGRQASGGAAMPVSGSLVVPGPLTEVDQRRAQEQATLANPEAIVQREASSTEFEAISRAEAAKLAGESFPTLIDDSNAALPRLSVGQSIGKYPTDHSAQVNLGDGQHAVVESLAPLALETTSGRIPVDLGLTEVGGAFEPKTPLVDVRIPKSLDEGVRVADGTVSLTPVDAQGTPLTGTQGTRDGATVFFGETQTDADTVIKPSSWGFAVDTLLRSENSPQHLHFRVGMPEGARLVQAPGESVVQVVKEGATIATVPPPHAQDANGSAVPVSMSVSGPTLILDVASTSQAFRYPIDVDPEFNVTSDKTLSERAWTFVPHGTGFNHGWLNEPSLGAEGGGLAGQWAEIYYQTTGNSKIYQVNTETTVSPTEVTTELFFIAPARIYLELEGSHGYEGSTVIAQQYVPMTSPIHSQLCPSECSPAAGAEHNLVRLADVLVENNATDQVRMQAASVAIAQPKETHAAIKYNTTSAEVNGTKNVLYNGGAWLSPSSGAIEFTAQDDGIGIAEMKLQWNESGSWLTSGESGAVKKYLGTASCGGIQCAKTQTEKLNYANLLHVLGMPNGEEQIRVAADDAMEHTWSYEAPGSEVTLKVDKTAPHALSVSGLSGSGENLELGEVEAHVKVEAKDGEGTVPSSGIKSITFGVDGKEVGKPAGSCPLGPCTASGEWSLNGAELGTGAHTLTVVATDNAGNVESKHYNLTVYHASPVAIGPGSVNPESGDFALGATDVSVSGGAGTLAVTRHYDSRNVTEGAEGPLGPQWSVSLGDLASLEVLPDKSVLVVGPEGLTHFSVKTGGGLEAPPGDSNLTLELKGAEYLLKNTTKGTTTKFTQPPGAKSWMPTVSEGPVATNTMTDTYTSLEVETGKIIVEPKLELAPHPSASCPVGEPTKWEPGCRGLEFVYGTSTNATGENESEWGEYKSRLMQVLMRAYNPATKAIETKKEAEYAYDNLGRLRAEWDPEVAHGSDCSKECKSLKVVYGYDAEGHITALTPPGQETWAFTYGTSEGDNSPGRLVKVYRAPASETQWAGGVLSLKTAPKITGTPFVGDRLTVNEGKWKNGPVAYGYQWERCSVLGLQCMPIPGATNPNYTVTTVDLGHVLTAFVTATNGGGSLTAQVATNPVHEPSAEYSVPAGSQPTSIVRGPDGNMWFTDEASKKIGKITNSGAVTEYPLPTQDLRPRSIVLGPDGNLWIAAGGGANANWLIKILPSGAIAATYPVSSEVWALTAGPDGNIWFTEAQEIGKMTTGGTSTMYPLPRESEAAGITVGPDGNLWFAEEAGKIGKITTSGVIHEYPLPTGSGPRSITLGSDGNLWFDRLGPEQEGLGYITPSGAVTAVSAPLTGEMITGPDENLWMPSAGTAQIFVRLMPNNGTYSLAVGCVPWAIASGTNANMWYTGGGANRIGKIAVAGSGEAPKSGGKQGPEPGWTIEYNVPLSGTGLPTMTETEVAKWGQVNDLPKEATAIFPPDEPQGWPASDYKRATISYFDKQARTVNVAAPSGAISTSEYNGENAVTRTLSGRNRTHALSEGGKSAEVAKLLDSKNAYNAEGQLTDTWGPQHTVKLAKGKEGKSEEVLARNHLRYFYNEGAKEVEEKTHESYALVTKTEDGAETVAKEEFDKRVSTSSYGGQSNLGWKLRMPTSVTTDPGGLNLTTTTKYDESTGNVIETKSPAGAGGDASVPPAFSLAFGSPGAAAGQLNAPTAVATDASGNKWVVDGGNNRIEEFSATTNAFVKAFGFGVSDGKEALEVCTSSCRAGMAGAGAGEFNAPWGIAIDQSTGNIYVSDFGNNRLEKFSSSGALLATIGTKGSGEGQLLAPRGIVLDSSGNVWVADSGNYRVEGFSPAGTPNGAFGKKGTGNLEFNAPYSIAISGGNLYVTDSANNRVQEASTSGAYLGQFGSPGSGPGQLSAPIGIATNPSTGNLYVTDSGNHRVAIFTAGRAYVTQFGSQGAGNGQFSTAAGIASDAAGQLYVVDASTNDRVQKWVPTVAGAAGAHETKTIYYTAKAEAEVETCRNHPEWTGLPCQTTPVAQPGISGLPQLPVTTIRYNIANQPEQIEETFGSGAEAKTRTKKTTYDPAGRAEATEEMSSINAALPKLVEKYSAETGAPIEQSTTAGGTTKTIKSAYNTLGQLYEYTDAAGNTASFEYEKEKDARLVKVADVKGSQAYHYDETTGSLKELVDSGAGTFKATYDVAGAMTSETYPNAMTASFSRSSTGEVTGIEYVKTAHCAKTCPEVWFSDTAVASVHGEVLKQASTLAEEPSYSYDAAGRLTQVQESPTGEGCTTRGYSYDEEGNRAALSTSKPNAEGKCTSEGATTEWHTYDTANRLTDPGVVYEPFGNTTKLPATDSGGSELVSEYYVDSQVAKQEQNNETIEYKLDPEERTLETISKGNTTGTSVSHYDGAGGALAWTGEGSGEAEKWTRNIPGMGGALTGIQAGEGKTTGAVVLQLHDLQGNIVAEASDNEAETKLLKTYNSTEFGVPSGKGAPPKYSWLGAEGVAGELPSGVITQDGITYVPQTGRPLQTEGVALIAIGNSATPFTRPVEAWVGAQAGEGAARELANAEQERAEREAANKPPGEEPVAYPSSWCGGEYGACPLEGSSGLEGGCSGGGACAASYNKCELHYLFGEPHSGELWLAAGVGCSRSVAHIQVEACFWAWILRGSKDNYENYNQFGCETQTVGNNRHAGVLTQAECSEGETYRAWVWGRAWGASFWFATAGKVSDTWTCADAGYTVEREYFEYELEK